MARSGRNASGRAAASSRQMAAASWIAASASSRRPRSPSRTDRLFSDPARSGRNASGRAAASSRQMPTASWIAASASSRRPRSPSRTDRLFSDPARRLAASGSPPRASARYWVTCWLVRVAASAASRMLCSGSWLTSVAAGFWLGAAGSARGRAGRVADLDGLSMAAVNRSGRWASSSRSERFTDRGAGISAGQFGEQLLEPVRAWLMLAYPARTRSLSCAQVARSCSASRSGRSGATQGGSLPG